MRILSAPFLAEQIKANRTPLVKVEVASYGHPAAVDASALQWSDYFWVRLTAAGDATVLGVCHAVAIPSDGSVCRVRNYSSKLYFQRVTSPGAASDWTAAWTNLGSILATGKVTVAARAAEVIVFGDDGVNLYRRQSADSGATWAAWVSMANARPGERGLAASYKANGDMAIVHASDFNDPTSLYIQKRVSGTWSTGLGQISGDFAISALALYHDGDWNILALLLDGSNIRLARGIYGDGDQYSVGTWSGWEYINSYKASISFTGQTRLRLWHTQGRGKSEPTYYERVSAVNEMRDADLLGVDDPFITYNSSLGTVFSFARSNSPWFYRLKAGTEFKDSNWNKAWPLDTIATQGLALACDGTYLYATAPNQVWRTALPGAWAPPTAGAGAGTDYAIPNAHVLGVKEQVVALAPGNLTVTLDNSQGTYNSIGGGAASAIGKLKLGAQVTLSIGYYTGSNLLSVAGKYYVEHLDYSRAPGQSHLIISAVDAWALLHRYAFNRAAEWNAGGDVSSVYAIASLIVQAVGGTLSYKSRSSDITGTYPRLTVNAGENGAAVLRQILSLVPDVIFFVGLTGYIVYPQATDASTYELRFPI
jgi:hypothetical protein